MNMETTTTEAAASNQLTDLPPDTDAIRLVSDLIREIFRRNPGEMIIPLKDLNGEWLGNLVSPQAPTAAADRVYSQMPPEERQAMMKPLLNFDPHDTLSDDEVADIIKSAACRKP